MTEESEKGPSDKTEAENQPRETGSVDAGQATPSLESIVDQDFPDLLEQVDKQFEDYVASVLKHPIRQFQKSTVDDFLKAVESEGLPVAVARAVDSRDYVRGNTWESARMEIMNSILPRGKTLSELLKQAVQDDCSVAVKWFVEACGNPSEIVETLEPALRSDQPESRWWAAIHLSRYAPDTEGLPEKLIEALEHDWIAMRIDNSSTGITGKGEAAKAIARLDKYASSADKALLAELEKEEIEPADVAEIAGTLLQLTGDLQQTLEHVTRITEKTLIARRGTNLHGGDRELLKTLSNLITRWNAREDSESHPELSEKVSMLEKEIAYHLAG